MKKSKIILLSILGFILILCLVIGLGYYNVFYTKTAGKAQQKAKKQVQREVFEQTQSYVEGKRQEIVKYRLEYMKADSSEKHAIKMTIIQSFANFDESLLNDPILESFIRDLKYNP